MNTSSLLPGGWAAGNLIQKLRLVIRRIIHLRRDSAEREVLSCLGLAEMHALFAIFPLFTLALAGLILGERISLRHLLAAAIGFTGTLIILRPGIGVFESAALIPLLAALTFALYNLLTRRISL